MATSRRMTLLDGLRAIAALMVVVAHSVGLFAYWPTPSLPTRLMISVVDCGSAGVQVFFVLSGFVIAYTLRSQVMTVKYAVRFILRRSIRLDPPYWAAIALHFAYVLFRRSVSRDEIPLPTPEQTLSHLFYLQDILGYGDMNVVFWTLCIEVQFYLVFCILLGMFRPRSDSSGQPKWVWDKPLFVALYILSLAWPAQLLNLDHYASSLFLPYWYAFLLGAIVWWVVERTIPRRVGDGAILVLFIVGALRLQMDALVVASTASVILIAAHRHSLYCWLDVGWVQFLGKISYSIYLVHVPIVGAVLGLQARMAPRSQGVSFVMLALAVGASIGIAFIFNRVVEVPAIRLSRRFKAMNSYL